jgi:homeobox-leucine zipper protein
LSIADETLTEFISKATGTAVEWVQMPGMKPGPDSIGIVAISHGCTGIAARACGLVGLDPTRVAEILKDKPCWLRDCRSLDIVNVLSTANGGTLELIYMQVLMIKNPKDDFIFSTNQIIESHKTKFSSLSFS